MRILFWILVYPLWLGASYIFALIGLYAFSACDLLIRLNVGGVCGPTLSVVIAPGIAVVLAIPLTLWTVRRRKKMPQGEDASGEEDPTASLYASDTSKAKPPAQP